MIDPQTEERAALQALGWLDEAGRRALARAASEHDDVARLLAEMEESSAALAYDAPQVEPPAALEGALLRSLPARRGPARTIAFPGWLAYALAACLMGMTIYQATVIFRLDAQVRNLHGETAALRSANDLRQVQIFALAAKDPGYGAATVMVAWDPVMHHGVVSAENLPPAPAGHDYQLWVLDPKAPAPVSAGLLKKVSGSEAFAAPPVGTAQPGFAVSLEPGGGRPEPTGAILFAVAPVE
jgi:anti-sigma-K factor RskA